MLMDSGNSSSMQSNSSGGDHDHEYDSRSFFHNTPPPPQTTSPLIFSSDDPNFLQPFSDLRDPVFINWPKYSGSDVDVAAPAPAHPYHTSFAGPSSSAPRPPPLPPQTSSAAAAAPPPPPKNPKKRTRASRRAPTTVLTTDTSNFRAMVQEFTGIPAPPFSAAAATSAYSRLLGAPFRPAAPRMGSSQPDNIFSSSLLSMGGQPQSQLLVSGQRMGFPKLPGQPDPILAFQSLLQQQQQQQSNSSQLLGYLQDQPQPSNIEGNAAFGSIGNDGGNNIYSNTNEE